MKYIVKIDYKKFNFNDSATATGFAELALNHSDDEIRVEIVIEKDKEGEEDDE